MSSLEEKRRQRELERQKEIEELERKRKEREEKRKRDREELEKKEKELQERRRAKLAEIGSGSISSSFDSGLNSRLNPTPDGRLTSSDGNPGRTSGPSAEEERKKKEKEEAERKQKEKEEEERRKREREEEERKRKEKEEAERKQKEKEDEEKRKAALEAAARVPLLAKLPPPRGSEMDSELERLRKERERKAQERELRKKQGEEEALALKKKLELLKEQKEKELEEKMRKEEERKKELEEELRKQREQVEKLAREKEKEMDREMKREKERLERERLKAEREQREKEREEEKKRRENERKERERLELEKREAEKRDREERERLRKEEERKRREEREAERARKLEADRQEREKRKKEREEEERKEKEKEEQEKQRRLAERKAREEKEKLENEERERKRELERQEKEKALQAKRAIEAEEEARMKKIQEEHAEEEKLRAERALLLKKVQKEKKKKEREEQMEKIRQEEEDRKRKKEEEEAQKRLLEDDEEDEEIKQLKAQLEKLKAENERIAQEEKLREEKARAAAEERPKTSRTSSRRGNAAARQTSVEKMGINSPRIVVADSAAAARDQAALAKRSQSFRARKVLIPADEEDLMAIFTENREKTSSYRSGKKDSGGTRTSPSLPTVNSKEKAASSREKKNPVLIQLKGDKRVHVRKCETVATCFNYSDVFLLDAGDKIYQWNGPLANRNKRAKGVDVANAINKKQRGGGADVIIIEALIGEDDGAPKEFWAALGGKPETIPETKGNDAQLEKQWTESDKLYRVNPGGELFKIDGSITRAKLASNFVYVLDCTTEVYVWCGKETDAQKKEEAVRSAKRLFLKNERPPWSVLRRINEGAEPVLFVEKFAKWEVSKKKIGKAAALAANTAAPPQPGGAAPRPVTRTESPQRRSGGFSEEEILKQYDKRYTYDQLLRGEYPASINTAKKEEYLSDAEFETVFGMTKEVFYKQPAWKIRELKIKTKLF